ncbi:MAG TPA: prolyl-tRNA synthetase associated domain-containing protein [Burkholderiaceae bacterium]|nr:prolyl-tRNA synthetase associated domain-containing protein [Burkholderiaceae bacterium]
MGDRLLDLLDAHAIAFERCDHPAVFTTAEAERLIPPLPGAKAKNLFLADPQSSLRFLVVVPYAKRVDLARLATLLDARKLRFGSADALQQCLGVTPGSVSLLALVNDVDRRVDVVIDAPIWSSDAIQCHPLVNTATLVLAQAGLRRFLQATGHAPRVLDVPARADPG